MQDNRIRYYLGFFLDLEKLIPSINEVEIFMIYRFLVNKLVKNFASTLQILSTLNEFLGPETFSGKFEEFRYIFNTTKPCCFSFR